MPPLCASRSSSSRVDEKISTYREEFCATPHRNFNKLAGFARLLSCAQDALSPPHQQRCFTETCLLLH